MRHIEIRMPGQRWVTLGVVAAMAAAVVAMSARLATASVAAPHAAQSARLVLSRLKAFAGYTDSIHPRTGRPHPMPWQRSRNVIFKGCNYFSPSRCPRGVSRPHSFDAGAIRLDNGTSHAITVTKAWVVIGSCRFRPWPGLHVTVPRGKMLILTQTGGKAPCHPKLSPYNFDTSSSRKRNAKCNKNDGKIPVVHLTVDGVALTYRDTGQILNTGGKDPGNPRCGAHNETHPWAPLARRKAHHAARWGQRA